VALSPAVRTITFVVLVLCSASRPPVRSVGRLDQAKADWALQAIDQMKPSGRS
jgi:hypothetical protein